jgi:hypothetical protein
MDTNHQYNTHNATNDIENLQLHSDDDDLEIQLEDDERVVQKTSFRLVGRFLTNRPIRAKVMIDKMGDIWQPGRGITIEEAYPGLFVFQLFHQLDVQRILKQGPWLFDNHTLVLNTLADDDDPREVPLFKVPFWIQVHNLPSGYMSLKTGQKIAEYIGEFLEYDEKNDSMAWVKYMRIRVLVDIRLPLKRAKKIKKPDGEGRIVNFKYERLGTFCYICGMLGHSEMHCPTLFETQATAANRAWGPELRADARRKQGGGMSKWIRDEANTNWVAPNPVFMSNQCSNSQRANNETNSGETAATSTTDKGEKKGLAEIFRNPHIFYPNQSGTLKAANNHGEGMEEDIEDELIIKGGRKRSRNQSTHATITAHEKEIQPHNNQPAAETRINDQRFLLAGPGGARQGQ